jgi:ferredoxin
MGFPVLVFYIDNILVDKNTLCKGCFLTGILVQFRVFKYYGQCLNSCHMSVHKLLKNVHEDSMQFLSQKLPVPMQPSVQAFEGVWTPLSV